VRAGVNWNPGVIGHATFQADTGFSPGGYALSTHEPVISRDVAAEKRFEIPDLLLQHGVKSMVNVLIRGQRTAFGILEVDSRQSRDFDDDDISFLQNYANLMASAVDRLVAHRELRQAAETRAILVRELQHRVMNILANVAALVRRTHASSAGRDDFLNALESRLNALARVQDILTRGSLGGAGIRELLHRELSAHGAEEDDQITLQGSEIELPPKTAQALSLMFHELATNAVKHGALGIDGGRINISWSIQPSAEGDQMSIRWREHGVQIPNKPSRRGLGSEAIEESLPYMLGAAVSLLFRSDGVECTVLFPFPSTIQQHESIAGPDE